MKKIIKKFLIFLIFIIIIMFIHKINENFDILNIFNTFEVKEKTDDYTILKNNLEKEAHSDSKTQWLLDNFDSLGIMEQNLIGNDQDTVDFVYNYENDISDFSYSEGESKNYGRATPFYLQWDNRWAYKPLSSSNIGFSGCGPTSMAMILSRLENDPSITPLIIAEDANSYMGENGISWNFFTDEAYKYNRNIENVPLDKDSIINALEKGPILVSVSRGYFTINGHILVIDSYSNGKFIINDPNSLKNSSIKWDYDTISNQIVNMWLIY